ncbi:MAG: STAS domain-containing protein [Magnetococcales bacterium]|nr:STAS domain-containing protein [Magnetococcales bacterium]
MEDAATTADANGVLHLPPRSTIREVAALRDALLGMINQGGHVVVDCSAVEQSDLSVVQMIIAARRTTHGDELALSVILPPLGPMADQIRACGLEHEFEELRNT